MQAFVDRLLNLFRRTRPLLVVSEEVWDSLQAQLRERGAGARESGAFLLGPEPMDGHSRQVLSVVYYDDLDPTSLTGGISFAGSAYGRLWDECEARGLRVVADIHTHPGRGVSQSSLDREHPMLAEKGHVALIVPHFAERQIEAEEVGVHRYLGDGNWWSALGSDAAAALTIDRRNR